MKLQADNLKAQNAVLIEQAKNIAADTISKGFGSNLKEFDLNFKTDTRNMDLYKKTQDNINAYRSGNLTVAQIANTLARTESENAMRQPRIRQMLQGVDESVQRVISMRLQMSKTQAEIDQVLTAISNAKKDGTLKDLEILLKEKGVSWSDPAWQRKAIMLLESLIN